MNDTTDIQGSLPLANARVAKLFAAQEAAFLKHPFPTLNERRQQLKALKVQVRRYQEVLTNAMSQDFGYRSPAESKMLDLLPSTLELNHENLKKFWDSLKCEKEIIPLE